jgi:hypothetical protein
MWYNSIDRETIESKLAMSRKHLVEDFRSLDTSYKCLVLTFQIHSEDERLHPQ